MEPRKPFCLLLLRLVAGARYVRVTPEDLDWDYLKTLPDLVPKLRNKYAHGSTMLHNWSLQSFQLVSEIINQLWQPPT